MRPRILLVKSAYHMTRDELLFRRAGFEVTPVPRLLSNFDRRHPAFVHSLRRYAETNRDRSARIAWATVLLGVAVRLCLSLEQPPSNSRRSVGIRAPTIRITPGENCEVTRCVTA